MSTQLAFSDKWQRAAVPLDLQLLWCDERDFFRPLSMQQASLVHPYLNHEFPMKPPPTPASARLNCLLAFIELDASNLVLRREAIREASETGQWEMARELIEAGLQLHPEDDALMELSSSFGLQMTVDEGAEQSLSDVVAQGLNAPDPHYDLALDQFMRKHYADALELLTPPVLQALPIAALLRARCLTQLGRVTEAIEDCKACLAWVPEDAEANGLLGLLLCEQNEKDGAQAHAEAALLQNPKQLDALLALASLQSAEQNHEAARRSFDALLQAHPECGRAWLGLGLIELSQGQLDAAKRAIEMATTYMPEDVSAWHVLAWIQMMRGDVLAAELAFDLALTLGRNSGETHGGVAVVAALQGRAVEARASIQRALRLNPQTLSAQYAQMLLMRDQGQHAEAQAVLDAFLTRPVTRSDMQYRALVTTHMKYLRPDEGPLSGSALRH